MDVRGIVLAIALATAACGAADASRAGASGSRTVPPFPQRPGDNAAASSQAKPAAGSGPRVVVLGDSLTAGLGLPVGRSYPALLQQRLKDEGLDYQVVNAGVSGDTSAGGLARLHWALDGDVAVMDVALGGGDGRRRPLTEPL